MKKRTKHEKKEEKSAQHAEPAEKTVEKPAEKTVEKDIDKIPEKQEQTTEKLHEATKPAQRETQIPDKEDLEKKVKAEKEDFAEKLQEHQDSSQSSDENSYKKGYSNDGVVTYVKTQVTEPTPIHAPAYKQSSKTKEAYIASTAMQRQPTPSHLEIQIQAADTIRQEPSYAQSHPPKRTYSNEKTPTQTPSAVDSLLSVDAPNEFAMPQVRVTAPQSDLAGMQRHMQSAQTVYTAHKTGQKIAQTELLLINDIKKEIGYKGSCCDELVVQKYAERKAGDARKAA
jgi:hypothetical protein